MRILVVGGGGREHALTWKLQQSPQVERVWTAPGNAATPGNLPIKAEDLEGVAAWVAENPVDLVVVGPEAPLAAGLADRLSVPVFGPSQRAAEIEASKAFAKDFMVRHNIPTAGYASFSELDQARDYLRSRSHAVVLKASGLAAGKGVILPKTLAQAELALEQLRQYGSQVVIEEYLEGREVSLMAFTDSQTVRAMPPACDHKRLHDKDQGPNTGGMGAYAPDPLTGPEQVQEWTVLLERAVQGLAKEGRPFRGVLYAGLMITEDGPRVLEFNCRFGDPETQVVLPLLESDLAAVLLACAQGRLGELELKWKPASAACVVMAAEGYPGPARSGDPISGLERTTDDTMVFQAGTRRAGEQVLTAGGRVLGVTGWGPDLEQALERSYARVDTLSFPGCQCRRDIGARALSRL